MSSPASEKQPSDDEVLQGLREYITTGGMRKTLRPNNHMMASFDKLEVVEAQRLSKSTARAVWRFSVEEPYLNLYQAFSGGAQSTMHDACTSFTMLAIAKPGFWRNTGLTRNINVTYLAPAMWKDVLLLECEIVHAGKRLALVKGVLRREKDGVIVSSCEHHKYNVDSEKPEKPKSKL